MSVLEGSRWTRMLRTPARARVAPISQLAPVMMNPAYLQGRCGFRERESRVESGMARNGWDGTYLILVTFGKLDSMIPKLDNSSVDEYMCKFERVGTILRTSAKLVRSASMTSTRGAGDTDRSTS